MAENNVLTAPIVLELLAHEGVVQEAYRDSVGVWTWSVGITDASGHKVFPRYKDKPATLERCMEVYLWLLREKYLPAVNKAFGGKDLTEAQLGAALSFHWNTGAIGRATWVKKFLAGDLGEARKRVLDWAHPAELIKRRQAEAALFFDGKWTNNGTALVYQVSKPSYRPVKPERVDMREAVKQAMAAQ